MEQHAYGGWGSAKSGAKHPIRLDRRNGHHHSDLLRGQPVVLLRLAIQRSADGQLDRRYRLTFSGLEGGAEFLVGHRHTVILLVQVGTKCDTLYTLVAGFVADHHASQVVCTYAACKPSTHRPPA